MDYVQPEKITHSAAEYSIMQNFAMCLSAQFIQSGIIWGDIIVIHGDVLLSDGQQLNFKKKASVFTEIHFPAPIVMPEVYTTEPWIKTGPDWHIYESGKLCWGLPEEWHDTIKTIMVTDIPLAKQLDVAANWCVNHVKSLLARHWHAHLYGLNQWPEEWDYWNHGTKGIKEYEQQKRTT